MSGLGKVSWAVLVLLIAAAIAYIAAGQAYAGSRIFTSGKSAPVSVTAEAGEKTLIQVQIPHTVNGLWASPTGVQVVLPGRPAITLVPAGTPSWGGTLRVVSSKDDNGNDEISTVSGEFTVPADLAPGTVAGRLQGTVTYPVFKSDFEIGQGFNSGWDNTNYKLANPVKITVLPSGALSAWKNGQALTALEGLSLALAALLAGCLLWLVINNFRFEYTGMGCGGWVLMPPLAAICGIVALGIGAFVKYFALAHDVSGFTFSPALVPFWVLPILTGLAGLLVVVNRFAQK